LFRVSKEAYYLFFAVKNTINRTLHEHLCGASITTLNDEVDEVDVGTKQTIVEMIPEDGDVLFRWIMVPPVINLRYGSLSRGHSVSKC